MKRGRPPRGKAPNEVQRCVLSPVNLRASVLPGATLELRVCGWNKNNIAIVGPGSGFSIG